MKNKELLPCPFCGKDMDIKLLGDEVANWWIVSHTYTEEKFACRAFMESEQFYVGEFDDGTKQRAELIKRWNTRTNTIPVGNGENYEVTHNDR